MALYNDHLNFQYLKHLFPSLFSNKTINFQCKICEFAKQQHTYFLNSHYKPSKSFTLIHSDLWKPSRFPNHTKTKWFVTFIDDYTRDCWVYLLKEKFEVRDAFINFHLMIQIWFQSQIQILWTDNSTKYFNNFLGIKVFVFILLSKMGLLSKKIDVLM